MHWTLIKMTHNNQNPTLWPLENIYWDSSIDMCHKKHLSDPCDKFRKSNKVKQLL